MDNASLGGFTKSVLLPVTMVSLSSHSTRCTALLSDPAFNIDSMQDS